MTQKLLDWLEKIAIFQKEQPCILCHDSAQEGGLCEKCYQDIDLLGTDKKAVCLSCASPSLNGIMYGHCQKQPPILKYLWASFDYDMPLSGWIYAIKHQAQLHLIEPLAKAMMRHEPPWLNDVQIDSVLAVPLHRERHLKRGFNQSDELAKLLARNYGWNLLPSHIVGRQPRPPQSTMSRKDRLANVKNVFYIPKNSEVKNCNLLLIDDVVTSGATLHELARTLRKAGANNVYAWTAARPKMQKF